MNQFQEAEAMKKLWNTHGDDFLPWYHYKTAQELEEGELGTVKGKIAKYIEGKIIVA